ncbi:hypothetical protein FNV43_RR03895 [Rhamnella rubrinervis]|uniref:3-ketoacyl-CoA synthase n=1 Tax=Rhamnella rubrinervis TaxID=2594499 RepID=A0A8K0MQ26_9ROSA|nr:hypothetical protein FNV43_RR03895 [Rhamnella rubrinervis]
MISNAMYVSLLPFIMALLQLFGYHHYYSITLASMTAIVASMATLYFALRSRQVYLLDFACYKPQPYLMCSGETFINQSMLTNSFSEETLGFQKKILEKSGYGPKTYVPETLLEVPLKQSIEGARKETEMVMFGAIDELLAKTGVEVKDIGILVVNSSMFNPTPSLSAMVVNRYKLRGNILSYSLGGMGCSASLIAIDLAKRLLQNGSNSYALVVSAESMTLNWYGGANRSMLITNCLFRLGAAAILLSNRTSDRRRSKYQLRHTVRTHKAADDEAYKCVFQQEDEEQKVGIALSRDLMAVAGEAIKTNMTMLVLFVANLVGRKMFQMKMKQYVPDFKLAFEHICIHAGGRAVLDKIEKNLALTQWHMEPSRMTLYRFGNTSSSSVWYELAYSEAKGRVKKGDRIWQIAFGSGFKCNSAVWRALRTVDSSKEKGNPWMDEIDEFPVDVPEVAPIVL